MSEEEGGRGGRKKGGSNGGQCGGGVNGGGHAGEGRDFNRHMRRGFAQEDVSQNDVVDSRARGFGGRDKSAIAARSRPPRRLCDV